MKWERRNEGVCDLELGKYKFRWCLPEKTVRHMGGMMVAADVATEEQATDAVRWFLRGRIAEGDDAQTALEALGGGGK